MRSTTGLKKKIGRKALKSALITFMACLLAYLIVAPLSESLFAKLFSGAETSDFNMSDMFIQFADSRPVRHLDDRIVLVDIGYAGRGEIAEALDVIAIAEPKVVGLDVNFPEPKGEADTELLSSIMSQKKIVLPLVMEDKNKTFTIAEKPFFYDSLGNSVKYGAVNLPAKSATANIREFEVEYSQGAKMEPIPSFVVEMVRLGDPEAYTELKKRGNERETIDYASKEFTVIPIDRILDRADELTGKYVLVGSMGDAYDMHSTPLNSYQSGLMIHASALSTILDGKWFVYLPDIIDYITAAVLCFLLVFASEMILGKGKDLALRLLQLFILILIVWIGYNLFIDHHTIIDLSYTFFVVGIGLFVEELCDGVEELWRWLIAKHKQTKLNSQNNIYEA